MLTLLGLTCFEGSDDRNGRTFNVSIKFCVLGLKSYGINGKEALTGDWEELSKETCM